MIVPSKSKSMPRNEWTWGGASKDDSSTCKEPIMEGLVVKGAVKGDEAFVYWKANSLGKWRASSQAKFIPFGHRIEKRGFG
jgi:hypothetical protein